MPVVSIVGLVGIALLGAAGASALASRWRLSLGARIAIPLGVVVVMLVPVGDLTAAGYVRGVIGDLSITSMVLLVATIGSSIAGRTLFPRRDITVLSCVAVIIAALLYPLALGASAFDPYALGFGSMAMAVTLLLGAVLAWYVRLYLLVLCVTLGVAGYLLGALESRNLWDYLLDVPLAAYALSVVLRVFTRRMITRVGAA